MKEIQLTNGGVCFVDDSDYDLVRNIKWHRYTQRSVSYAIGSVGVKGRTKEIRMHRFILGLTDPKVVCDHIDLNGLNNQRYNLRSCTISENLRNTNKPITNKSGYKGVHFHSGHRKYRAKINVNKKEIYIGLFSDIKEAALAYNEAAIKYHGEFARLNIITND